MARPGEDFGHARGKNIPDAEARPGCFGESLALNIHQESREAAAGAIRSVA
jgi:hypothetical protein